MRVRVFFLLILSVISFAAGEVQFDLSSYEPIAYRTVKLSLYPKLASSYEDQKFDNSLSTRLEWIIESNTRIRIQNFFNSNNISFSTRSGSADSITKKVTPRNSHSVSYTHKRYNHKNLFLYSRSSITYQQSFNVHEQSTNNKKFFNDLELSKALGLGAGRYKDVKPAALSLHIFRLLQDEKVLLSHSQKEIHKIAQLFERLHVRRSFDSRETRIKQIKEITDQLYVDSISKKLSPEQLMRLLDYWEYGFNQQRTHGKEFSLNFSINQEQNTGDWEPFKIKLASGFKISNTPKLNLFKYLSIACNYELYKQELSQDLAQIISAQIHPSLSIYPSLRSTFTIFNFSTFEKTNLEVPNHHYNRLFQTTLGISFDYFIRPQLSYRADLQEKFLINNSLSGDNHIFDHIFRFTLTYHIR